MDLGLTDRVVLVTGGSRGLGKTICRMLAEEGARVAVNYRSRREEAEVVARGIQEEFGRRSAAICGDVSREADVIAMFDEAERQLGPVDVLVNNAAVCPVGARRNWPSTISARRCR